MRINGRIHYELEHGEGAAGVISLWSVPYSAWMRRGHVVEVEADGLPALVNLTLKVGQTRRELELPTPDELRIWQDVWRRDSRYSEAELLELFAADCRARHWDQVEMRAA